MCKSLSLYQNINGLDGTEFDSGSSLLLRRRLARRLRFPVHVPKRDVMFQYEPSQKESEDATGLIYTGGFGSNDVSHTIHDGLAALQEIFERFKDGKKLIDSDLVLLRVFFNEQERKRMVADKNYADSLVKQHSAP